VSCEARSFVIRYFLAFLSRRFWRRRSSTQSGSDDDVISLVAYGSAVAELPCWRTHVVFVRIARAFQKSPTDVRSGSVSLLPCINPWFVRASQPAQPYLLPFELNITYHVQEV
jgi:hypothetical protein